MNPGADVCGLQASEPADTSEPASLTAKLVIA